MTRGVRIFGLVVGLLLASFLFLSLMAGPGAHVVAQEPIPTATRPPVPTIPPKPTSAPHDDHHSSESTVEATPFPTLTAVVPLMPESGGAVSSNSVVVWVGMLLLASGLVLSRNEKGN
ncbi:MAG: hypothetical protein JXA33_13225 [Anaerolineae bacterium]|nr:hypothetical protein [Anaerolineae bacterium]